MEEFRFIMDSKEFGPGVAGVYNPKDKKIGIILPEIKRNADYHKLGLSGMIEKIILAINHEYLHKAIEEEKDNMPMAIKEFLVKKLNNEELGPFSLVNAIQKDVLIAITQKEINDIQTQLDRMVERERKSLKRWTRFYMILAVAYLIFVLAQIVRVIT